MELLTVITWMTHCSLLLINSFISMRKPYWCKISVMLYCFYSVVVLIPFRFDFFGIPVTYTPSALVLSVYIITDLALLLSVFVVKKNSSISGDRIVVLNRDGIGCQVLLVMACLAQVYALIKSYDLIFLPKDKFIIASSGRSIDLFFYHFPYDTILLGGLFFSPFKSKVLKFLIAIVALATVCVSVISGYRHLAFLIFSYLIFSKSNKISSPILVALLLTFIGEVSNYLKWYVHAVLFKEGFELSEYLDYISRTYTFQPSPEQMAILTNFVLSLDLGKISSSLYVFANLLPFSSSLSPDAGEMLNSLGGVLQIPNGQGAAYNFQLFVLGTYGIGLIFMWFSMFFNWITKGSTLSFVSLYISYSILRDEPSYWISQIKMGLLLTFFVFALNQLEKMFRPAYSNYSKSRLLLKGHYSD
ncbi:hypothetical protein Lche_2747 [Legionella cherrii]|uniref:Oligosaccharide repeat unit polymerase n=1 Tax=Legionella cherrii TaxID=28084 RepID=A0A0W0SBI2_9GAMM|nr:hypothetical protein [Legionella cherrii]KTC80727.1 hypothetical protein Lche_2747 [Legionella cherrii]